MRPMDLSRHLVRSTFSAAWYAAVEAEFDRWQRSPTTSWCRSAETRMVISCRSNRSRRADKRMLDVLLMLEAKHGGAIAFSRTGDPNVGEFGDAEIIATYGEVDKTLLGE